MADEKALYTAACVQGGKPPCTCSCPFNFDLKNFYTRLKAGNFETAYRDYANRVVFPDIVSRLCDSRCMENCPEEISALLLERSCVEYAANRNPQKFNLPKREGSVAIIGGGLSGLACAQKLAVKKYDVTVFERESAIGGSLRDVLPESVYMAEIDLQFKDIEHTVITGREISSLDEIGFNAIYIATGQGGNDFGLKQDLNPQSLATVRNGVFLGGRLTGKGHMDALAQGILAAASIERFLRVSSMSGQPESFYVKECTLPPLKAAAKPKPIKPENEKAYSKEEAEQEASRCLQCDCTICRDTCEFMKEFKLLPKRIEGEAQGARTPQIGLQPRIGTKMIVSCSLCGHCEAVCDFDISVEKLLLESKIKLFEDGAFAPAYHDFYMRDMDLAMGEAYLADIPPGHDIAEYMFFPGCQMTASNPEYVRHSYSYMREKFPNTAIMTGCCAVPALYGGDIKKMKSVQDVIISEWERFGKPEVVLACPTCAKAFKEFLPEISFTSLYEFVLLNGVPEKHMRKNDQYAIFDPCSSRKFPGMQEAVRELCGKIGLNVTELSESGERALCCGMGGHIYPANPGLSIKMTKQAAGQSDKPYITYCTNCAELFRGTGKTAIHIIDSVFDLERQSGRVHISDRRLNRLKLKKRLLKDIWGTDMEIADMMENENVKLFFSEEVLNKMDRLLISEEDVLEVVKHCENEQETILNTETGTLTGHKLIGIITYWVEYKKSGGGVEIVNAYSHRMRIS